MNFSKAAVVREAPPIVSIEKSFTDFPTTFPETPDAKLSWLYLEPSLVASVREDAAVMMPFSTVTENSTSSMPAGDRYCTTRVVVIAVADEVDSEPESISGDEVHVEMGIFLSPEIEDISFG